ncbi:sulfite exporter TauE/SafE family protein [Flavobacterium sp. MC2016-06]|uniref:sulfite exporter TauE/SafE family protein n=1 Tax=Flavobacterium sp. MC2016-06 TaxID=2676308 RepID=UPI0012BB07A7|nr:sulfite exporter TauE/SafE family protein [Flavobacterium sp. MC2016-06]MBU3858366.1 sulfite exporter TauE/SafE family protein [Flavobacterium sp. MC2016-06]
MNLLSSENIFLFSIALIVIAFLYASVGHGGASGYLALMSIFAFPIVIMKPSALLLNLFVSSISFLFYYRMNYFKPKLFYPFAIASIPAAFIGGFITLDNTIYKIILGIVLVFAALRLFGIFNFKEKGEVKINLPFALAIGFAIGLLSGMLGIGGGIILSPILLFLGWASIKESAAISSLFIFVNSLAGLMGFFLGGKTIPMDSFYLVPIAVVGGVLGGYYGSGYFTNKALKIVLGTVILMASIKLIFP